MDKYLIFLKPEFDDNQLSSEEFENFFRQKDFTILKETNYLDSTNSQVIKGGVLIAKKKEISIKLIYSQNLVITYYDTYILELLEEFSQTLSIPTYIHGENDEEY